MRPSSSADLGRFAGVVAGDAGDRLFEGLGRQVAGELGADPPREEPEQRVEVDFDQLM
jgi:hypothetical protein